MVLRDCVFIFSVLTLKTEERVRVSQKHELLHKQLDSLAVSCEKKSSISVHGKSKFVLIYQPDASATKPAKKIIQTRLPPNYFPFPLQTDETTKNSYAFTCVVRH